MYDPDLNPFDCILPWERQAGDLAEYARVMKWYEEGEAWLICTEPPEDMYYNNDSVYALRIFARAPAETICGPGHYGMFNYAWMRDSGEWQGGAYLWSGSHLLPDTSSLAGGTSEELPPPPDGISPEDTAVRGEVMLAGPDGKPIKGANGKPLTKPLAVDAPTASTDGGPSTATTVDDDRTVTTDEDGNVTETVVVDMVRPYHN